MRKILVLLLPLFLMGSPLSALEIEEEAGKGAVSSTQPVERGGILASGRLVIEPSFQYSRSSAHRININGWTIFEAIHIGQIEVSKIDRDFFLPSLSLRYGLKNLEFNVRVPALYRADREIAPVEGTRKEIDISGGGLGDIEGNIYYHMVREGRNTPDIILSVGAKSRTGRDSYSLKKAKVADKLPSRVVEFPTGTGHWGFSGGLTLAKTSDPAVVYLNSRYYYNTSREVGEQRGTNYGEIDLGDSFEYTLGMGFALNERISINTFFNQRFTGKTRQNGRKLVETGSTVATLNIGVTHSLFPSMPFEVVVQIGLTEDSPDVAVQFRLPYTFLGRR
ncbi:MAG: hypothetical protein HY731_14780 [Candidatus Tectomicrobia bacterium]|nr:hypothetical protein [Candidatus Tectomicrobia bacterium]